MKAYGVESEAEIPQNLLNMTELMGKPQMLPRDVWNELDPPCIEDS